MNDWYYFFNRVDDNLATSAYRIFEEQFKTEIFDWFSREDVEKEQKEDFIQALVEFKDDCGDFYHYRAYLLAAEALNYFKDCSRGDEIASQILKWSYSFFRQDKQDWQIVPQPLAKAARATLEKTDKARVVSAFVHLVHTTQSRNIRRIAAEKLGKLDPGNKSAIAALVLLLQVTQDRCTLWGITYSLTEIDPENPVLISTLVKLLQDNTDTGYCHERIVNDAIAFLADFRIGKNAAIDILVQLMQMITEELIGEITTKNLRKIATAKERVINVFIELIQVKNPHNIHCAVIFLGKIATDNQAAIATLIDVIKTTPDKCIRDYAIISLGEIASGNQSAIAAFTEFLQINQGDSICFSAAKALWQIDEGNENAITSLLQTLETLTDVIFLDEVAEFLLKIKPGDPKAIAILTERIKDAQVDSFGYHAAIKLVQFAPGNVFAISILVNIVETTEDNHSLHAAIWDLKCFAAGNKDAIAALTKLIASTDDNDLLLNISHSLGRIDPGNQKALSTLIEFIQNFNEWDETELCSAEDRRLCRDFQLLNAADKLQEILLVNQMPQVVVALKDYLSKSNWDSSYRYEACYSLIWHCAQNMTYPDFFEAWHKSP